MTPLVFNPPDFGTYLSRLLSSIHYKLLEESGSILISFTAQSISII